MPDVFPNMAPGFRGQEQVGRRLALSERKAGLRCVRSGNGLPR